MNGAYFRAGDEVAVLPHDRALPSEVLEIATVAKSGPVFVQLTDGRRFAALGSAGLNTRGCIVLARREHRTALLNSRGASAAAEVRT